MNSHLKFVVDQILPRLTPKLAPLRIQLPRASIGINNQRHLSGPNSLIPSAQEKSYTIQSQSINQWGTVNTQIKSFQLVKDMCITDITVNGLTISIKESSKPDNFFGVPSSQLITINNKSVNKTLLKPLSHQNADQLFTIPRSLSLPIHKSVNQYLIIDKTGLSENNIDENTEPCDHVARHPVIINNENKSDDGKDLLCVPSRLSTISEESSNVDTSSMRSKMEEKEWDNEVHHHDDDNGCNSPTLIKIEKSSNVDNYSQSSSIALDLATSEALLKSSSFDAPSSPGLLLPPRRASTPIEQSPPYINMSTVVSSSQCLSEKCTSSDCKMSSDSPVTLTPISLTSCALVFGTTTASTSTTTTTTTTNASILVTPPNNCSSSLTHHRKVPHPRLSSGTSSAVTITSSYSRPMATILGQVRTRNTNLTAKFYSNTPTHRSKCKHATTATNLSTANNQLYHKKPADPINIYTFDDELPNFDLIAKSSTNNTPCLNTTFNSCHGSTNSTISTSYYRASNSKGRQSNSKSNKMFTSHCSGSTSHLYHSVSSSSRNSTSSASSSSHCCTRSSSLSTSSSCCSLASLTTMQKQLRNPLPTPSPVIVPSSSTVTTINNYHLSNLFINSNNPLMKAFYLNQLQMQFLQFNQNDTTGLSIRDSGSSPTISTITPFDFPINPNYPVCPSTGPIFPLNDPSILSNIFLPNLTNFSSQLKLNDLIDAHLTNLLSTQTTHGLFMIPPGDVIIAASRGIPGNSNTPLTPSCSSADLTFPDTNDLPIDLSAKR